jgi:antitoxin PrlF
MTIESKLTSKGQTTIPVEVRDYLKIGPGDRIQFVPMDGKIEIIPRNRLAAELFGRLQQFAIPDTTLDDYKASIEEAMAGETSASDPVNSGKAA